jgi:NADH-quinone oxidoreductase subunit A
MESVVLPIFLFIIAATVVAVGMLLVPRLIAPRRVEATKQMPYESGMDPIHDARRRFDVRFYLVAVMFLLFDVELLFLYPWAVASRNPAGIDAAVASAAESGISLSRLLVLGEVLVFIAMLAAGLVYAARKGVFRWR